MAMDRETGKELTGAADVEQAIGEILRCIPGDRIMRADYGSELFELTDTPMNGTGKARFTAAVAEAIKKFEPRVRITKATITGEPGVMTQTIVGTIKATNQRIVVTR